MKRVVDATAATTVASTVTSSCGAALAAIAVTIAAIAAAGTLCALATMPRLEVAKGASAAATALVISAMPTPADATEWGTPEKSSVPKPID